LVGVILFNYQDPEISNRLLTRLKFPHTFD